MNKPWKDVTKDLPNPEDEDSIYLAAYFTLDDDADNSTIDDLTIGLVRYYGNNNWKDTRWEKVIVKYWMEIPPLY